MSISKLIADKKRYRQYRARKEQLPVSYRTTLDAVERYVYYFTSSNADHLMRLLEDLADLFEQAAASGTPIKDVVGEDPVEFADGFIRNYPEGSWISKERNRLTSAIERAEDEEGRATR